MICAFAIAIFARYDFQGTQHNENRMSRSIDISIRELQVATECFEYRTPMKFGGRVVKDVELLDIQVVVESRNGVRGTGNGSTPLGNIWAWPSTQCDALETLNAMRDYAFALQEVIKREKPVGHPLEIAHQIDALLHNTAMKIQQKTGMSEGMPRLAQLFVFSPFDAAIHDAYGRLNGLNSYFCLGPDFANCDISHYLSPEFRGEYLEQYVTKKPQSQMPLYHLVGALDPLTEADISERLQDGLPQTLGEWILADGLTHLKIKLAGDDLDWDIDRVLSIDACAIEAQQQRGCKEWFYSADFNEKCQNVDYVIEFLNRIQSSSSEAFDRIQYIEQPTHRDLKSHPDNVMHKAAQLKPVVIDESLVDFETLQIAREQGYSGVALKACKGHSEALLMGAAAQKFNMFLCVQDLTCVGRSFLHSASLASRIPTVTAIEGNGRQYCPIANEGWKDRFTGMFDIRDGTVKTSELFGLGLGF